MRDNFSDCTLKILSSISNVSERIRFVEFCGKEYQLIDILTFYYLKLEGNPYIFGLILMIVVPYVFFFLRHLCEQHIAHLIPELADKLGMSKNLSAIILTSIAISFNNFLYIFHSEDTDHGIECLESGFILLNLFISLTLVIPFCIIRSSEVKIRVEEFDFLKEVILILVGLIFMAFYSFLG